MPVIAWRLVLQVKHVMALASSFLEIGSTCKICCGLWPSGPAMVVWALAIGLKLPYSIKSPLVHVILYLYDMMMDYVVLEII